MKTREELENELKAKNFPSEEELRYYINMGINKYDYDLLEGEWFSPTSKAAYLWKKWSEKQENEWTPKYGDEVECEWDDNWDEKKGWVYCCRFPFNNSLALVAHKNFDPQIIEFSKVRKPHTKTITKAEAEEMLLKFGKKVKIND